MGTATHDETTGLDERQMQSSRRRSGPLRRSEPERSGPLRLRVRLHLPLALAGAVTKCRRLSPQQKMLLGRCLEMAAFGRFRKDVNAGASSWSVKPIRGE